MNDPKWFENYTGQTTNELIALADNYRVDSIVVAFDMALNQKAERLGGDSLSNEEQTILAVEALEREVNNGGYLQFFENSSRENVSNVVNALRRINCETVAELTQNAIDALAIEGEVTAEKIEQAVENDDDDRDDALDECDAQYYSTAGDLSEPLFEFIKANKARINL